MALQDLIDDHLKDARLPKYVITLEGVAGSCSLPKNVRLRLVNCGSVTISSAAGNNEIQYIDGSSITIQSARDSLVKLDNAGTAEILSLDDCKLIVGAGKITKLQGLSKVDLTLVDVVVQDTAGFSSEVIGQVFRGSFQKDVTVADRCNITFDGTSFLKQVSISDSEIRFDSVQCLKEVAVMNSQFVHSGCSFLKDCSFSGSSIIEERPAYTKTVQVSGGDFLSVSGSYADDVTLSSAAAQFNDASFSKKLTASSGSIGIADGTIADDVSFSDLASILSDTELSGKLTTTGGRHRWDNVSVSDKAEHTDSHIDSTECVFGDSQDFQGGSFVKARDVNKDITGNGIVGRCKMALGEVDALTLSGSKSRIKIAETEILKKADISAFMVVQLDSISVVEDFDLSDCQHVRMLDTAGTKNLTIATCRHVTMALATIAEIFSIVECHRVDCQELTAKTLALSGNFGTLNFESSVIYEDVIIAEQEGGISWA